MFRTTGPEEPARPSQSIDNETSVARVMWSRVSRRLSATLGDDVYTSWFKCIEPMDVRDGTVYLSVPTKFLTNWIQQKYAETIRQFYAVEDDSITRVVIVLRTAGIRPSAPVRPVPAPAPRLAPPAAAARPAEGASGARTPADARPAAAAVPSPVTMAGDTPVGSPLDPRLTFTSFHVGRSNMLAHAAAQQVVNVQRKEAPIFNPLYVHSAVGLGKTHLLQATAKAVEDGGRRVLYLTAEKFMYGFVVALKSQTAIAFKDALRGIDVLVIDDVQFLHGRSVQQEFCHTINALIDAGRQVIVAADRAPTDLEGLDERIQSRLQRGLVVEIGALDEELRLRILNARIEASRAQHPSFDVPGPVVAHVGKLIATNGRDLEGAVNRLLAHMTLTGAPLDVAGAENAIRDLIKSREPKKVKIEDIQKLVASRYNVSRADILSSRRTATVVRPRQIAMYLAKALTLRSLPEIGRRFGGRDHTTVLHAVRKIETLVGTDQDLATEIDHLKRMLQE